jgi:hypothetical protein
MGFIASIILGLVFSLAVPIILIVVIVRLVVGHGKTGGHGLGTSVSELSPRQLTLGVLALAAGFAGIAALYVLPIWLFGLSDDVSGAAIFAIRLVSGVVVLALGLAVLRQKLVSGLLMAVGVITILMATPYIFENLGSKGILLVVFLVLVALVWLTVWLSKRGKTA